MTDLQMIQLLHEEASRPEIHERPRDYRAAVEREKVWRSLSSDEKRKVLAAADGEFCLLSVALEDATEAAKEAAVKI